MFLNKCIRMEEPKRRRAGKTDATSSKLCSFTYFINEKKVCKKTLLDTYKITHRRIQTLQDKLKSGIQIPIDQRGKHHNRPKGILHESRNLIVDHIKKFPRQESHYSRGKTQKEYLSPDLSLSKMYRCFQAENPNVTVSKTLYDSVFKQMNLRFGAPRSDTCKICDEFYVQLRSAQSEDDRKKIQLECDLHQSKASLGYTELKADIVKSKSNNSSTVVLCVDMQQVLFCPTLTHSDIFYQRQLSCYNFAIHNMGTNRATMHLWYECIAGRGSTEIASCLIKFVITNYNKLTEGEERKLIVWSDRCVGQNNNWRILNTYCYLAKCGYFTEINQKFLSSGHSFLPCDRDFAVIEKAKKQQTMFMYPLTGNILLLTLK